MSWRPPCCTAAQPTRSCRVTTIDPGIQGATPDGQSQKRLEFVNTVIRFGFSTSDFRGGNTNQTEFCLHPTCSRAASPRATPWPTPRTAPRSPSPSPRSRSQTPTARTLYRRRSPSAMRRRRPAQRGAPSPGDLLGKHLRNVVTLSGMVRSPSTRRQSALWAAAAQAPIPPPSIAS